MLASKSALLFFLAMASVTAQPITVIPTSSAPITSAPIEPAPVTSSPVTSAPVTTTTGAPITGAPVILPTDAPVASSPVAQTGAPVTGAPVTGAPVMLPTDAPVASSPVAQTGAPVTGTPITGAPVMLQTDAPVASTPVAQTGAPVTGAPTTEAPTPPITGNPVLPPDLQARSDFRCGVSELDARGNCKKVCADDTSSCDEGEFCWQTFASYCHNMPEGHPICDELDKGEEVIRRCGFEELDAREYCGKGCTSSVECDEAESCFPVQRNFCEYFEMQDESADASRQRRAQEASKTNEEYFDEAKEVINPFFLKASNTGSPAGSPVGNPNSGPPTNDPTSACTTTQRSIMVGLLLAGTVFAF